MSLQWTDISNISLQDAYYSPPDIFLERNLDLKPHTFYSPTNIEKPYTELPPSKSIKPKLPIKSFNCNSCQLPPKIIEPFISSSPAPISSKEIIQYLNNSHTKTKSAPFKSFPSKSTLSYSYKNKKNIPIWELFLVIFIIVFGYLS
jgi:hypothetical protein